jgi:hypothetical protein
MMNFSPFPKPCKLSLLIFVFSLKTYLQEPYTYKYGNIYKLVFTALKLRSSLWEKKSVRERRGKLCTEFLKQKSSTYSWINYEEKYFIFYFNIVLMLVIKNRNYDVYQCSMGSYLLINCPHSCVETICCPPVLLMLGMRFLTHKYWPFWSGWFGFEKISEWNMLHNLSKLRPPIPGFSTTEIILTLEIYWQMMVTLNKKQHGKC